MDMDLIGRKDDEKARKYLITADCYIRNFEYVKAVEAFNTSICYSMPFSMQLPTGYVERAKLYSKMGLYHEAVKSINFALELDFNGDLRIEAYKKKELYTDRMCTEKISFNRKLGAIEVQTPTVIGRLKPKVPCASDCLEIKECETFGRYIVTKKDLMPGDIISLEPAYCKVLNKKFIYQKCTHCLKSNNFNLIPCKSCSMAMFCSERCYEDATYHKYECPIMAYIIHTLCETEYDALPWIAFRQLLITLHWYPQLKELEQVFKEAEAGSFNFQKFNYETSYTKAYMKYILSLTIKFRIDEEYEKIEEICKDTVHQLLHRTPLREIVKDYIWYDATFDPEKYKLILTNVMVKFFYVNLTNVYSLVTTTEWLVRSEPVRTEAFALAIFPFTTLINHACVSNVKIMFVGEGSTEFMVYVHRPIAAGKQIFISYQRNMNYLETPLAKRRQVIWNEFGFVCSCAACLNDYALGPNLRTLDILSNEEQDFIEENSSNIKRTRVSVAELNYAIKMYCKILKKYEKHYPCKEIYEVEKLLDHCIVLLYRNRPYIIE